MSLRSAVAAELTGVGGRTVELAPVTMDGEETPAELPAGETSASSSSDPGRRW